MATPLITWLLSILLATLPNCCAAEGPPTPPFRPVCHRQCGEKDCEGVIRCIWDPRPDPNIPTNYSLHWESANSEEGNATNGTSLNGVILREHFFSGELRVWVQASNLHGSAKSQEVVINTEDIIKPLPPKFLSSHQDPLEVFWINACSELTKPIGLCDIRHRTEENQVWLESERDYFGSYTFEDPQPGTVYEFQVRCSCDKGLMSEWSEIHRITSAELAPVGEVDVWRDCEMSTASFDCFLTWKNLSISQARGVILGYKVRIWYNNGTAKLMDLSTTNQSRQFVCDHINCRHNSPLKGASSVTVSAYSALGATVPSNISMPTTGIEENNQNIHLNMSEDNLTVSWDTLTLSGNLKEYVVQYKQAECPPGQEFDWLKLNKSLTTGFFKGQFKRYTPYQVSLFSVSHNGKVKQLSSVIGYSLQKAPSKVSSFKVESIAATKVTLSWEPIPLCRQTGLILYYQIGVNKQEVYNVSAVNGTFNLRNLTPGQEYEVWIKAVTAVGPGANYTISFKTKHHEDFAHLIPVLTGIVVLVIVICLCYAFFLSPCREENKVCPLVSSLCFYENVPDPRNSRIIRQMKHQINEPLAWLCMPMFEPHHKISLVEVVEKKSQDFDPDKLTRPVVGDGCSQIDFQDDQRKDVVTEECDRTDQRYGREEYSKMLDSDEERNGCWSSSEEEPFTSGYEKHFMPTDLEILEV